MFPPQEKPASSSQYAPLALHDDEERSSSTLTLEERSSSENKHEQAGLLTEAAEDGLSDLAPSQSFSPFAVPKLILYFSFAVALLSAVNIALLPSTLSQYHAYPVSDAGVHALPHRDSRIGLDRAAKIIPPPEAYRRAWPDKMARVSRKLKNTVYGAGFQVYITVEDSTIMRFPIPKEGGRTCAISWTPPPEISARNKDLTTKGDITEIEVWHLVAPSVKDTKAIKEKVTVEELDYDTLSYGKLPVRGELLGTLDLTAKPNSTTVEFACPSGTDSLVVEMTCQRVACHVSYLQVEMVPKLGMELVRRRE